MSFKSLRESGRILGEETGKARGEQAPAIGCEQRRNLRSCRRRRHDYLPTSPLVKASWVFHSGPAFFAADFLKLRVQGHSNL